MSRKRNTYRQNNQNDRLDTNDQADHDYDDVDYDDPESYDEDEYEDEFDEEPSERRLLKSWEGRVSMALLLSLGLTLGGVMIYRIWGGDDKPSDSDAPILNVSGGTNPADDSANPSPNPQLANVTGTPSTGQTQIVTPEPYVDSTDTGSGYPAYSPPGTSSNDSTSYASNPSSTGAYGGDDTYGGGGSYAADGSYSNSTDTMNAYGQAGQSGSATAYQRSGATDMTSRMMQLHSTTAGSSDGYSSGGSVSDDAAPIPGSSTVEMVTNDSYTSQGTSATINVTASDPTNPMSGSSGTTYQDPNRYPGSSGSEYGAGDMYRQPSSSASQITTIPQQPPRSIQTSDMYSSQSGTSGYASSGYQQPSTYENAQYGAAYGQSVSAGDRGFSADVTQREYERMNPSSRYALTGNYGVAPSSESGGTRFGATGDGRYTVRPNDNYWRISQAVYGVGHYFRALAEYNRATVPREDDLNIGDEIETPSIEVLERDFPDLCPSRDRMRSLASRTDSSRVSTSMLGPGEVIYEVQNGDSLFDIARYELDDVRLFMKIYERNKSVIGDDFNYLTPGMKLVLPAKQGTVAAAPASNIRYAQTPNYDTRTDYSAGTATSGGYDSPPMQGKCGSPSAGQYAEPSTGYQNPPASYPNNSVDNSYKSDAAAAPYRGPSTYDAGSATATQPSLRPAAPTGGMWR